jgi:hypothetical protein
MCHLVGTSGAVLERWPGHRAWRHGGATLRWLPVRIRSPHRFVWAWGTSTGGWTITTERHRATRQRLCFPGAGCRAGPRRARQLVAATLVSMVAMTSAPAALAQDYVGAPGGGGNEEAGLPGGSDPGDGGPTEVDLPETSVPGDGGDYIGTAPGSHEDDDYVGVGAPILVTQPGPALEVGGRAADGDRNRGVAPASDEQAPATQGLPVSTADVLTLAGLGAAGVTVVARRRIRVPR